MADLEGATRARATLFRSLQDPQKRPKCRYFNVKFQIFLGDNPRPPFLDISLHQSHLSAPQPNNPGYVAESPWQPKNKEQKSVWVISVHIHLLTGTWSCHIHHTDGEGGDAGLASWRQSPAPPARKRKIGYLVNTKDKLTRNAFNVLWMWSSRISISFTVLVSYKTSIIH